VGQAFGYYTGKFLLMIAALGHVKRKCDNYNDIDAAEYPNKDILQGKLFFVYSQNEQSIL
jgi:hypothetical protein